MVAVIAAGAVEEVADMALVVHNARTQSVVDAGVAVHQGIEDQVEDTAQETAEALGTWGAEEHHD